MAPPPSVPRPLGTSTHRGKRHRWPNRQRNVPLSFWLTCLGCPGSVGGNGRATTTLNRQTPRGTTATRSCQDVPRTAFGVDKAATTGHAGHNYTFTDDLERRQQQPRHLPGRHHITKRPVRGSVRGRTENPIATGGSRPGPSGRWDRQPAAGHRRRQKHRGTQLPATYTARPRHHQPRPTGQQFRRQNSKQAATGRFGTAHPLVQGERPDSTYGDGSTVTLRTTPGHTQHQNLVDKPARRPRPGPLSGPPSPPGTPTPSNLTSHDEKGQPPHTSKAWDPLRNDVQS